MPEIEVVGKDGQFLGRINDENQTVEMSEAWRARGKKKPKGTTTYPPKGSPKPK